MDAYFWIYFKNNYPTSNLKVQEVIQQKKFEYGVRVNDNPVLAECFREERYTKESDFYEHAELFLEQSLSVSAVHVKYKNIKQQQSSKKMLLLHYIGLHSNHITKRLKSCVNRFYSFVDVKAKYF